MRTFLLGCLIIAVAACGKHEDSPAPTGASASSPAKAGHSERPVAIARRTLDGLRGDDHAEFAMTEKQVVKACTDLSSAMTRFITQLDKETQKLNAGMADEDPAAPRKFGEFLQRSTVALEKVKADGDLGAARDQLVTSIKAMGAAYLEFANAWDEHQDTEPAQNKMQGASEGLQSAFAKLADVCTG